MRIIIAVLAIIASILALAAMAYAQSTTPQTTQSIIPVSINVQAQSIGNSSIGHMYPGNYTMYVAVPTYKVLLLNSSGSPVVYALPFMRGGTIMYLGNVSLDQSYLLYVYLLNGSSIRIGYSWVTGKEAEEIIQNIQNGSWAPPVRLAPINEYPRGNITIMVRLPTGAPANNGYVYMGLPFLAQSMYGPVASPLNAAVQPSLIAPSPWPSSLFSILGSAPVINGRAIFINAPLIPYIAAYYYFMNISNMTGLRPIINETSSNETLYIYGHEINVSIITVTYREINPSLIVIMGQGLVIPSRTTIINTTLEELQAPLIMPLPKYATLIPITATSTSDHYQVIMNRNESTRYLVVPPALPSSTVVQYMNPFAIVIIIIIVVVAILIGAAAAIIVKRKVQSL
jgi:hypothetical protein